MRRIAIVFALSASLAVPTSAMAASHHHARHSGLTAAKVHRAAKHSRLQVRHVRALVAAADDPASAQRALDALARAYAGQLAKLEALTAQQPAAGSQVQALLDRILPLLSQRLTALLPLFDQLQVQVPDVAGLVQKVLSALTQGSLPTLAELGTLDVTTVVQQALSSASSIIEQVLGALGVGGLPVPTSMLSVIDGFLGHGLPAFGAR
jgi:hypothetical protein